LAVTGNPAGIQGMRRAPSAIRRLRLLGSRRRPECCRLGEVADTAIGLDGQKAIMILYRRPGPFRSRPSANDPHIGLGFRRQAALAIEKKFPTVLGSRPSVVVKKQLGGHGSARWCQVRVAEQSRNAADSLCSSLKSVGGQCLVLTN
jgi:hypothetical protein